MADPYATGDEHLWDELSRIDVLVRARAAAWERAVGSVRMAPEGLPHVSEGELYGYLRTPAELGDHVAVELETSAQEAHRRRDEIDARLAAGGETPRVARLAELFGLSALERDVLLVCLLPELDDRYRRIYGFLQDDATRSSPSAGLVVELLRPVAQSQAQVRAALTPAGVLTAQHLVVVIGDERAPVPLTVRPVRVDDRIAAYLLGSDAPDGRVGAVLSQSGERAALDALIAPAEHVERLRRLGDWAAARRRAGALDATVLLNGPWGSGRTTSARALCAHLGMGLLEADARAALQAPGAWETTVALAFREARLRESALLWRGCEALLEREAAACWDRLLDAAEAFPGLALLETQSPWDPAGRFREKPFVRFDLRSPGFSLRRRLWDAELLRADAFAEPETDRDGLTELLANSFQFTAGQIRDSVATARGLALQRDGREGRLTAADLAEGSRRQSARRLVSFTTRIEPRTELSFDDLVLPPANLRQLRELRERIANRGRVHAELGFDGRMPLAKGLIVLFAGSTGTGKTMAAELLARDQGVDLYKVDLSAIVSKYVGDTEKNLSRVFAEAEDANAIIFFDEADALFGKRGEVNDARDRWANMEVNYLLQRVEEYAGVVVLASNLRQNIDDAFTRRIAVIVEFPFPDARGRLRILRGLFPPTVERPPDEELELLAERFRLSGGSARNVVVDAAFRAVAENPADPALRLRHLVVAIAREYQKLGKPITRGEFGEGFYALLEEDVVVGGAT